MDGEVDVKAIDRRHVDLGGKKASDAQLRCQK